MKRRKENNGNNNKILISIVLFGLFLMFIASLVNGNFLKKPIELLVLELYGISFTYFGILGYFILNDKRNYLKSWKFLKQTKYYILFVVLLFVIFVIAGYFFEINFITEIIRKAVNELIDRTKDLNFIEMFLFIFQNNSSIAFISIIFGFFFGIFPFVTTVFNGYVIGFVMKKSMDIAGPLVVFKLLPHGIFELPAIIISIALGLKLGMFIFSKNPSKTFKDYFKNSIRIFIFIIVPLLVIAAFIEAGLIFLLK